MFALTVCQPWAWGIVAWDKDIENRSWATKFRGLVVIHAGKSRKWMKRPEVAQLGIPLGTELVFGAFVGTAEIVDCVRVEKLQGRKYAWGPWCFLLKHRGYFRTPIPALGSLGLWNTPLTDQLMDAIVECEYSGVLQTPPTEGGLFTANR